MTGHKSVYNTNQQLTNIFIDRGIYHARLGAAFPECDARCTCDLPACIIIGQQAAVTCQCVTATVSWWQATYQVLFSCAVSAEVQVLCKAGPG